MNLIFFYSPYYSWNSYQYVIDESKRPRAVTINEQDPEIVMKKIDQWLSQHYPGYQINHVEIVKPDRRVYARANFRTADRQEKTVLFDVTAAAQSYMNTMMRMFSPGTVVRLWPGAGSRPTRYQVLI